METLFHLYVFAGMSFAFSAISLAIGLYKEVDKVFLFFGLMSFCVGMYYLLFPMAVSSNNFLYTQVGLSFFIVSFGLFPWFLKFYANCRPSILPALLSSGMMLTLVLFYVQDEIALPSLWNMIGHIFLIGIAVYGITAAQQLRIQGNQRSANILTFALAIFILLTIDDIIYIHFREYYLLNLPKAILPFDYFFILFMIIMGVRLAREIQSKVFLEMQNALKEKRWQKLLDEVELIIVELSPDGEVRYVNPYFLKLSGYEKDAVIGNNWFANFLPENVSNEVHRVFDESQKSAFTPNYRNPIITADGEERMIVWSNVLLFDDHDKPTGSISIGSDITEQENAFQEIENLQAKLEVENVILKSELSQLPREGKVIGSSDAINYVIHRASQVADTDTTVLLEGETGVGKEVIANLIQSKSSRAELPFIKINCSALPAPLLESELFGHVKGAFTGAEKNKLGLVEMASGGTLFLDEIGEFPLELQPKLLRFLQEGEFMAVGGEIQKKVDVRIIAATNRNLHEEVELNRFREDLYYRINVYPITIPPLRSRKEDIPEFTELFVNQYAKKHGKSVSRISKTVMDQLKSYQWPGNIRELENVIERAIIINDSDTIRLRDIPLQLNSSISKKGDSKTIETLANAERHHIVKALKAAGWKVHGPGGAADILDINPNTLRSRMKKLNINKPS